VSGTPDQLQILNPLERTRQRECSDETPLKKPKEVNVCQVFTRRLSGLPAVTVNRHATRGGRDQEPPNWSCGNHDPAAITIPANADVEVQLMWKLPVDLTVGIPAKELKTTPMLFFPLPGRRGCQPVESAKGGVRLVSRGL
jgi:hypothetical protein